ncbi:SMI1/KNR4 family protein [Synechococcus sp. PCC 6312]|uniref:SMI1/KNR4 family protein n=1 Tax=Synechococcus sp. (strain ATCC 27167 / PCC 6312) TaxID=195253 RepID=UPI00029ED821|nr:SMI1/KNR4 family protein [Synechococcus sp. PCC 6312]AFY61910.1 hypothetical protein Syn6312_2839 [Synechococcus sp. PCC 6312]
MSLNQWYDLLAQLELSGDPSPNKQEDIAAFANICGFKLPQQFQDYCQVFGYGKFAKTQLSIYCINPFNMDSHLAIDSDIRETFSSYIEEDFPWQYNLLKNSFMFGTGDGYIILLWDLRTYSETDDSYDIYIYEDYNIDMPYCYLGRDFYAFVRDFCMGQNITEAFADIIYPKPDEDDEIIDDPDYGDAYSSDDYTNSFKCFRYQPVKLGAGSYEEFLTEMGLTEEEHLEKMKIDAEKARARMKINFDDN